MLVLDERVRDTRQHGASDEEGVKPGILGGEALFVRLGAEQQTKLADVVDGFVDGMHSEDGSDVVLAPLRSPAHQVGGLRGAVAVSKPGSP